MDLDLIKRGDWRVERRKRFLRFEVNEDCFGVLMGGGSMAAEVRRADLSTRRMLRRYAAAYYLSLRSSCYHYYKLSLLGHLGGAHVRFGCG